MITILATVATLLAGLVWAMHRSFQYTRAEERLATRAAAVAIRSRRRG